MMLLGTMLRVSLVLMGTLLMVTSQDGIISFGETFDSSTSFGYDIYENEKVYLVKKFPEDGIFFKMTAYFTDVTPIIVSVWEQTGPTKFKLKYKKQVHGQKNMIQTIYMKTEDDNGVYQCAKIKKGDRLALYSEQDPLPVAGINNTGKNTKLTEPYSGLLNVGLERKFQEEQLYPFAIKGYMQSSPPAALSRRRKRTVTACPSNLLPMPSTTTTEIVNTPTITRAAAATTTRATAATAATATETITTAEIIAPSGGGTTRGLGSTVYIAIGVVCGLAVIIIVVVVVLVLRHRRKHKAPPTTQSNHYDATVHTAAAKMPQTSTKNVVYGMNCDFLKTNTYEEMDKKTLEPQKSNPYTPIIPPRPGPYEELDPSDMSKYRKHSNYVIPDGLEQMNPKKLTPKPSPKVPIKPKSVEYPYEELDPRDRAKYQQHSDYVIPDGLEQMNPKKLTPKPSPKVPIKPKSLEYQQHVTLKHSPNIKNRTNLGTSAGNDVTPPKRRTYLEVMPGESLDFTASPENGNVTGT